MPLGIGVGLGLIIVLYTLVAIVTTGMVSYKDLAKHVRVRHWPSRSRWSAPTGLRKIISLGIVIGHGHRGHGAAAGPDARGVRHEP